MNKLIVFLTSIINVFFVWLFVAYDMAKNWLTKSLKRLIEWAACWFEKDESRINTISYTPYVVAKVNAPGGNAMHWYRYCH